MTTPQWEGFLLPARSLTEDEIALLSPLCENCSLTATVVEAQEPFAKPKEASKPLIEFSNDALRFYCIHHSPIELEQETSEEADYEFYIQVKRQVRCPQQLCKRFASNCINYEAPCLSSCSEIQRVIGDVPLEEAKLRVRIGRRLEREQKEKTNDEPKD